MNPKKAKEFIKPTAEQLNVSADLVDELVIYFWKELKKSISKIEHYNIVIPKLGKFRIIESKLYKNIRRQEAIIESCIKAIESDNEKAFKMFTIQKECENNLEKMQNILEVMKSEKIKRLEIKKKRYESNRENLEE